uniref:Putative HUA2-like protein 3 n=2 Tax=Davidia involucrata TaxID=16924 RepID=A0A5B6ZAG8_DAVIN
MAPSRRKGGSKASAAAAAARRQWKVGDLVLAKVKGFPAWPATVSEPEKWGYPADWKKVLVYFFGTKQIAFCNPADVEAFTEEKKESLLIKRHGKGADFVRAVHEIIDSYEKLKKQDLVVDFNSGDEVTVTNAGNLVESLYNFGSKDETGTPAATLDSCPKSSFSTGDKNEPNLSVEDAGAVAQKDALHDREPSSEDPTDNLVVTEKPLSTTYSSRKRLGGIQPQSCDPLKRLPSARRSRSSSRVDSFKFPKLILPSSNGTKNAVDVESNALRDGSVTRNKRIRKSPDVSEGHDADSPAFVSNGSVEENGSEIVTVDSDTSSLNEGSTVESGCKHPQPESIVECCEGDVELSQTLDFQTKSTVIKKKRKLNRKRVTTDTTDINNRLDKEAGSKIEVHGTGQNLPTTRGKDERISKEDGDEHLPLVKRARVRMGRSSSTREEVDTFIQFEEKPSEVSNSLSGQVCSSVNCEENSPADRNSFVVRGAVDNSSSLDKCSQLSVNKAWPWEGKKNKQFGCSVDGEAALPPSKRLHRALEAMSANAAEDGQACSEAPSTMQTFINGCFSSTRDCFHVSMDSKAGNGIGVQNVDSFTNSASQDGTSGFSTSSNPPILEESAKSFVEVPICNKPLRRENSPKHEFCEDMLEEAVDCPDSKDLSVSSLGTRTSELMVVAQTPKPLSPNLGRKHACLGCNQGSLSQMSPSEDECRNENSELSNHRTDNPAKELDSSENSGMSLDPVSGAIGIAKSLPQSGTTLLLDSGEAPYCEPTKLWKLPLDENIQAIGMCEVVKETKATQDSNAISSPTSPKVMAAAVQGSDDRLGGRDVSGIRSSSSPTDGVDSPARTSPPNTSICNMSASDNSNFLENNGGCTPDGHLQHEKPKHASKWNNKAEATAALASFEAILGTLTRTKESIGRATRIAIDCAKFGIAAKVVEILSCNLENVSSLHRRVDLFFLVDSITQCSRGLKGDIGGIYPSAIQAVLPRLLLAAAPPGSSAQENRRQCLKVLRLWLERKILPESTIRHHIRDLDSLSGSSSIGAFSRRPLRTERALDDPLREMEGTIVDEYGSNSSFQLPGFCMPPMLKDKDEGSDSDGGSFEAVTPEHNSETPEERERIPMPAIEKHRHILEDVDGELEMEDVAPSFEAEMSSTSNVAGVNTLQTSHHQFEQQFQHPFAPPLPNDVPPSSPPLPTSPPPPPPLPSSAVADTVTNGVDSKLFMGTHNIENNLQQSIAQQSVALGINSKISDAVHYYAPECRDLQMQMQIPDSANSCSFSSVPVSHPVNGVQQTDGVTLHNKAYHLPPPHPAPSNQFSYVQADQRVQSGREVPPPSYSNRFHFGQNTDGGNFYSDHDRMKLTPHERCESWRSSGPSFSGSYYTDSTRVSYGPAPFTGPPCEPAIPDHRWAFPPPAMNHREFIPHRPPSDGPIPVGIRAPSFWQPR